MNQNDREIIKTLKKFSYLIKSKQFTEVRGMKTVELLNWTSRFDCDGDGIIKLPGFSTSEKYVEAELNWYESGTAKAEYISNFAKLWDNIQDGRGYVNSNYGQLIYSPQNCHQYDNALKTLQEDRQSRRAVMVYCPPHIHYTGGNDYVCTMYVSYTMRGGFLHAFVSMRSSDLRFGIVGADLAWQIHVLKLLASDLGVSPGYVHWHSVSLHLYERHFGVIDEAIN